MSCSHTAPISWALDSWDGDWFTLSATQGTVLAGATDTLEVSINSNANTLPVGSYSGNFSIVSSSGEEFERDIVLNVIDYGFEWEILSSPPLLVDEPFSVKITAIDAEGNIIPDFTGTVDLSGQIIGDEITSATLEWSVPVEELNDYGRTSTYNHNTDHFLSASMLNPPKIRVIDGKTGLLTGKELSIEGLHLGANGIYGICVDEEGVIYAGTNILSDGVSSGNSLIRWENEDAVPTQIDPATPLGVGMEFPRVMDAIGSGTDTILAVAGSENYKVTFLTTTDGINFSVTDYTPSGGVGRKPDGTSYVLWKI